MFTVRKNLFKMWAWERENTCVLTLNRPRRDNQGHRQEDLRPSCRPPGWRVSGRHRYALYTCTQNTHTCCWQDIFNWHIISLTRWQDHNSVNNCIHLASCQRIVVSAKWPVCELVCQLRNVQLLYHVFVLPASLQTLWRPVHAYLTQGWH